MISALKKILGIRAVDKPTETSLFSGSAYFSNRVPKTCIEKWVTHGGEISSGATWDARARYFFATDPSEPWVMKLFAKSVVVIHAGWIVHCVDEAFRVPIAEYILGDRFVPGPPYKLINITPPIYVPLSEPDSSTDTEFGESGPTPVQTSDTPSTPMMIIRRKRKREQAYFDSPSGSLVFSGFDKDGMPRRPRKQRKLRFDPSFSPGGGRPGKETGLGVGLDWLRDPRDVLGGDGYSEERGQSTGAGALCGLGRMATVRSPDTPDKPLAYEWPPATCQRFSSDNRLAKPTSLPPPTIPVHMQEKIRPIRTIDFTNLPPPTRRWRFPQPDASTAEDTGIMLSVRPTEYKVKTPKKISFANHAQVCVYAVSPRANTKDYAGTLPTRLLFGEGLEDELKTSNQVEGPDDSTPPEAIKDLVPQSGSPKVNHSPARLPGGDQFENDTLTLTMEDVQAMRRRLLESAAMDGTEDGQLATPFELGRTFKGMTFRHVW